MIDRRTKLIGAEISQINFCKKNPSFMDSVRVGAARAIDECQYQFRLRRWNCSTLEDRVREDLMAMRAELGDPNFKDYRRGGNGNVGSNVGMSDYFAHRRQTITLPYKSYGNSRGNGLNHAFSGSASASAGSSDLDHRDYGYNGYKRRAALNLNDNTRPLRRGRRLSRRGMNFTY